MPRKSFAGLTSEGDQLLVTIAANQADLAFLEEPRSQLSRALEVAKVASIRQDTFKAQFQQSTRDLEKSLSEARELITRLRNGVRTQYGLRAEKLAEFGMQPRRSPAKAKAKQKPDPVPQPAPASQATE